MSHLPECRVPGNHTSTICGCPCHPNNKIVLTPPLPTGAEGPPCIWCNAPTKRTGPCFTCIACGASTSC